jgi:hypothetical protein
MKSIIDFVRNNRYGVFMWGSIVLGTFLITGIIESLPECVRLSSEEWVCTKAAPNGLATQCNEYQRVVK